jgi:RNA polymerase sigma-70 factor (ECF subfamily)
MAIAPVLEMTPDEEKDLVTRAQQGDRAAFGSLVGPWHQPLFRYVYRMVSLRQDAEDLLQDVLVRVLEGIRTYRGEARFKSWLFGIATHVCLDHLRSKKRWRVEAQLLAEAETIGDPAKSAALRSLMQQPGFSYEIREHIAFCFSCIARTLAPEEQAALMLKEVLGFTAEEAASILGVSEPVLRHRLSAGRAQMIGEYDGLCALINKSGICYQCSGLRQVAAEGHRGTDLVHIELAPGVEMNAENLFDERLAIIRDADLETGRTREMHDLFFRRLAQREESR